GWFGAEYTDPAMLNPGAPGNGAAQPGVVVLDVLPGGPAGTAGLRRGDILLKLDGEDILGQADLRSREAALAPGEVARLEGLRNGEPFAVRLTLMQRPSNYYSGQ